MALLKPYEVFLGPFRSLGLLWPSTLEPLACKFAMSGPKGAAAPMAGAPHGERGSPAWGAFKIIKQGVMHIFLLLSFLACTC